MALAQILILHVTRLAAFVSVHIVLSNKPFLYIIFHWYSLVFIYYIHIVDLPCVWCCSFFFPSSLLIVFPVSCIRNSIFLFKILNDSVGVIVKVLYIMFTI